MGALQKPTAAAGQLDRGGVRPFNYEGGSYHSLLKPKEAIRCFLNDLRSELLREDNIIK